MIQGSSRRTKESESETSRSRRDQRVRDKKNLE